MTREITFALGIPHCPWLPERVASFDRLKSQLGNRPVYYREFTDREPNWSWSAKLWQWAYDTGATHLIQLQDDVEVCSDFWPQLRSMVEAVPANIIGLESVLDLGAKWYSTSDGLIGVGYVVPRDILGEILKWRAEKLRPGSAERLNEDQLIGLFCFTAGRRIYHPTPTLIDHDVTIGSTYGNDHHSHRRPVKSLVRGDPAPVSWLLSGLVPHRERFYGATPRIARAHVKGYSWERYIRDSQ